MYFNLKFMTQDFNLLKQSFPTIKLSYEIVIHKKVLTSQFIVLIPTGKKCFLWFTHFNNSSCCFIVELNNNKQVKDIKQVNCCFNSSLSFGTILYGTLIKFNQSWCFTIEDLFIYKGIDCANKKWHDKLNLQKQLLQSDIKNVNYNSTFLNICLPVITTNINDISNLVNTLPYTVQSIQFKLFNKINTCLVLDYAEFLKCNNNNPPQNSNYNNKNNNAQNSNCNNKNVNNSQAKFTFCVKAELQNDVYKLYYKNNNKLEYLDVAGIPSYATSVMMNTLFRKIKENTNLDFLEESDDEDEFQNSSQDKFVDISKGINMLCQFNMKFKKWIPLQISTRDIVIKSDLPFKNLTDHKK